LQEIAHWLDTSLSDEISDLGRLLQTAGGSIGDRPAGFLLCLEIRVLEDVEQRRDDISVIASATQYYIEVISNEGSRFDNR